MFATFPEAHTNPPQGRRHRGGPSRRRRAAGGQKGMGRLYRNCVARVGEGSEQCEAIKAEMAARRVESLEQAETNPRRKRKLRKLKKKIRRKARRKARKLLNVGTATKKAIQVQRPRPRPTSFKPKRGARLTPDQHRTMLIQQQTRQAPPELAGLSPVSIGLDHYGIALQNAGAILNGVFEDEYGFTEGVKRRQKRRTKAVIRAVKGAKKRKRGRKKRKAIRQKHRQARRTAIQSI
jgi:hypothetical protein